MTVLTLKLESSFKNTFLPSDVMGRKVEKLDTKCCVLNKWKFLHVTMILNV